MNWTVFLIDAVFGAIPILAIAWFIRRLMRRKATDLQANVTSVLIAAVVGLVIRGFMEGEGGFGPRVENIASLSQLPAIAGGAVVALVLSILWWKGKTSQGGEND
jgi:hypothetical protein